MWMTSWIQGLMRKDSSFALRCLKTISWAELRCSLLGPGTKAREVAQRAISRQANDGGSTEKPLLYLGMLSLFSCPVVPDSLRPLGLQHTRLPCPSPSPRVCSSSCPLHQWCSPTISSSDALFSFCPQSFPESGTFPVSRLFESGDQNTGASASASVLPMTD